MTDGSPPKVKMPMKMRMLASNLASRAGLEWRCLDGEE